MRIIQGLPTSPIDFATIDFVSICIYMYVHDVYMLLYFQVYLRLFAFLCFLFPQHSYLFTCYYVLTYTYSSPATCVRFHCVLRDSFVVSLRVLLNHNLLLASLYFICSYNLLSVKDSNEICRYYLHIAAAAGAKNIFFNDRQLFWGHFTASCLSHCVEILFSMSE